MEHKMQVANKSMVLRYESETGLWTLFENRINGEIHLKGKFDEFSSTPRITYDSEKLSIYESTLMKDIVDIMTNQIVMENTIAIGASKTDHAIKIKLGKKDFKTVLTVQKNICRWILSSAESGRMLMEGYYDDKKSTVKLTVARNVVYLFQEELLEEVTKGLFEPSRIEKLESLHTRYLNVNRTDEFESDIEAEMDTHLWNMSNVSCVTKNPFGILKVLSCGILVDFRHLLDKLKEGMSVGEVFKEASMTYKNK